MDSSNTETPASKGAWVDAVQRAQMGDDRTQPWKLALTEEAKKEANANSRGPGDPPPDQPRPVSTH